MRQVVIAKQYVSCSVHGLYARQDGFHLVFVCYEIVYALRHCSHYGLVVRRKQTSRVEMDLRDRFCVNVGMRRCCQPYDRVAVGHGFESRLGLIFSHRIVSTFC